ncbi:MAG: hypothetical protein KGS61_08285 [Verrucomicrobia bacterium]|nr:hypothetical protein [Verrucomicrobiota bacterium]
MQAQASAAAVLQENVAPRQRQRSIFDLAREFTRISKLHDGLIPQTVAAAILGVSRQRIHQLVKEGTFSYWGFYGQKWLSQKEIISFARLHRKPGENQYTLSVKNLWRVWKTSKEVADEATKGIPRKGY